MRKISMNDIYFCVNGYIDIYCSRLLFYIFIGILINILVLLYEYVEEKN